MDEILRLPVWVQVNGGCLLDWKRRRIFKRILDTGKPVVLGSDCHNMRVRLPNLHEARGVISKKFSAALLDQMDQNAEILLGTGGM
jgi:tyrosine-protein phosphatase YwqE